MYLSSVSPSDKLSICSSSMVPDKYFPYISISFGTALAGICVLFKLFESESDDPTDARDCER